MDNATQTPPPADLAAIRAAFAKYMHTEGCGCCEDRAAHGSAGEELAVLLRMDLYPDGSGVDYSKYLPEEEQPR